jgi:hypothetical protein
MSVNMVLTGTPGEVLDVLSVLRDCERIAIPVEPVNGVDDLPGRPGQCALQVEVHTATELDELADRIRAAAAAPVG